MMNFVRYGGTTVVENDWTTFYEVEHYDGVIVKTDNIVAVAAAPGVPTDADLKLDGAISFTIPCPVFKIDKVPYPQALEAIHRAHLVATGTAFTESIKQAFANALSSSLSGVGVTNQPEGSSNPRLRVSVLLKGADTSSQSVSSQELQLREKARLEEMIAVGFVASLAAEMDPVVNRVNMGKKLTQEELITAAREILTLVAPNHAGLGATTFEEFNPVRTSFTFDGNRPSKMARHD